MLVDNDKKINYREIINTFSVISEVVITSQSLKKALLFQYFVTGCRLSVCL